MKFSSQGIPLNAQASANFFIGRLCEKRRVMKRLVVCHGSTHRPRYKNADTLDVSAAARPTFVGDLSDPSLSVRRHAYDRVILHHCPNFVLFSNAERAFHALFRHPGDAIEWGMQNYVEQEVPSLDDEEVVFDVARRGDSLVAGDSVRHARPRLEGWFKVGRHFYSNYTILPIRLKPISIAWLNLYSFVTQDGEVVIKAPMARTYAIMHAPTLSFVNALRSLAKHISRQTGVGFRHNRVRADSSFSQFVTPPGAPFSAYENYDWYLKPIPVMKLFTNLDI